MSKAGHTHRAKRQQIDRTEYRKTGERAVGNARYANNLPTAHSHHDNGAHWLIWTMFVTSGEWRRCQEGWRFVISAVIKFAI